jgi:hypothetical protein
MQLSKRYKKVPLKSIVIFNRTQKCRLTGRRMSYHFHWSAEANELGLSKDIDPDSA